MAAEANFGRGRGDMTETGISRGIEDGAAGDRSQFPDRSPPDQT